MKSTVHLPSVQDLQNLYPLEEKEQAQIAKRRQQCSDILQRKSNRKILVIGPCSLDFEDSVLEYAKRLAPLARKIEDKLMLIMRGYNAKPRTTVGRKGLLYNAEFGSGGTIVDGIKLSRKLFLEITKLGLPLANEMLYTDIMPYYEDLLTYVVVGARNSENQQHREVASGMPMPVGFKNPTSGDFDIATNNVIAASQTNQALIQGSFGRTDGNSDAHIVVRGQKNNGISKSHIDQASIDELDAYINKKKLTCTYVMDTSHDNSGQDWTKQQAALDAILQLQTDNIAGYMTESYLIDGKQKASETDPSSLVRGCSLTDGCLGREKTQELIMNLYNRL